MRTRLLLSIFLLLAAAAQAFEKPDYKAIEQATHDKASPYYYPNLFRRYLASDTTLTATDFHYLYFGHFFQDDYDRYTGRNYNDSIKEVRKKGELNVADKKKILRYINADLKTKPFNLNDLNMLVVHAKETGDMVTYRQAKFKFRMIGEVIMATGDGNTEETAMHVNSVSDEYTMIAALNYKSTTEHKTTDAKCDYIGLEPNDTNTKGLYFDAKQIFASYSRPNKK